MRPRIGKCSGCKHVVTWTERLLAAIESIIDEAADDEGMRGTRTYARYVADHWWKIDRVLGKRSGDFGGW